MNYYNEFDPFAAAWLQRLIDEGLIPPGYIDTRSIKEVQPEDVRGFTQCHFFSGIGGWSYALQLAGWPEDRPVWTGSCPCQPFSTAGKRKGVEDERHLWPEFARLIGECQPSVVFGEQVASKDGRLWLAGVRADLEGMGYAVGAADLCAAGIGAPHIRQRLYWVANTTDVRREQRRQTQSIEIQGERPERSGEHQKPGHAGELPGGSEGLRGASGVGNPSRLPGTRIRQDSGGMVSGYDEPSRHHHSNAWEESRWIGCGDGRVRRVPTEPSLFPLAHGVPNQLGLLRGAGNAIVPPLAAEFIQAFEEARA